MIVGYGSPRPRSKPVHLQRNATPVVTRLGGESPVEYYRSAKMMKYLNDPTTTGLPTELLY